MSGYYKDDDYTPPPPKDRKSFEPIQKHNETNKTPKKKQKQKQRLISDFDGFDGRVINEKKGDNLENKKLQYSTLFYRVDKVLKSKIENGEVLYYVKWKGTWETKENLMIGSVDAMTYFEKNKIGVRTRNHKKDFYVLKTSTTAKLFHDSAVSGNNSNIDSDSTSCDESDYEKSNARVCRSQNVMPNPVLSSNSQEKFAFLDPCATTSQTPESPTDGDEIRPLKEPPTEEENIFYRRKIKSMFGKPPADKIFSEEERQNLFSIILDRIEDDTIPIRILTSRRLKNDKVFHLVRIDSGKPEDKQIKNNEIIDKATRENLIVVYEDAFLNSKYIGFLLQEYNRRVELVHEGFSDQ